VNDFRKQAKDNPLKPTRVVIPQFDPLTEIDSHQAKLEPEPQANAPAVTKVIPPKSLDSSELQPEAGDIESYKNKYLQKDADKLTKTFRMYKWRFDQLEREARDTGLSHWQIIDIGLEMYFRNKQSEPRTETSPN